MSYSSWFKAHGNKHKEIVDRLKHLNDDELIEYFRFDNMVKKEPDFCPLYKDNKKCHDNDELNCYLCACPNFRFKDEGFEKIEDKMLYSKCNINSKDGSQYIAKEAIHQNCSGCFVPHNERYIKKHFSRNWFEIMENVTK
ncbi:MAG: hypothetical protein DSZ11_05415 [Sulfurovum sp.]|nr:MAG: hypothetical protein DSZ11_05415 [Sulfurovum sp.]